MFRIVDMVAHKYKHAVSDGEKEPIDAGKLTLGGLVFGKGVGGISGFNATALEGSTCITSSSSSAT